VCYLPTFAPPGPARISAASRARSSADSRRIAAARASTVPGSSLLGLLVQPGVQPDDGVEVPSRTPLDHACVSGVSALMAMA
jgi:hypothetical protein